MLLERCHKMEFFYISIGLHHISRVLQHGVLALGKAMGVSLLIDDKFIGLLSIYASA